MSSITQVIPRYRHAHDHFNLYETIGVAVLVGEQRFDLAFNCYDPCGLSPQYPQDVCFEAGGQEDALASALGGTTDELLALLWPCDGGSHYLFNEHTADTLDEIQPVMWHGALPANFVPSTQAATPAPAKKGFARILSFLVGR